MVRRAITVTLLIAGVTGVALAHVTLVRADPPAGGSVIGPPRQLRLEFSESVAARTSRIDLIAPDSTRLGLPVRGDSGLPNVLLADVPSLVESGPYRVEWRLVGADGHAVTGKYSFVVDTIPSIEADTAAMVTLQQDEADESPSDTASQRVIRFGSSLAMVIAIGTVAFALFVLPVVQRAASASAFYPEVVDGRLRSLGSLAGWALLIFAILRLVGHGTVLSGSLQSVRFGDLGDLITNSTFGRGWLLQMLATISLLVALRSRPSVRWRLAFVAVAGVTVAAAMLGHAAAVTGLGILPIGVDASHALAAGGWAGGIIVLAVAVLPAMARVAEGERLMVARSVLRAFSPLALACAGILAVTGVMSAWLQLRDLNLLLNSPYGLALTRKLVFVLLIGAVGAYHWRVAQPSLATNGAVQRLRVSLAIDATLVALVLVLTAMLTGTSPPPR